MIDYAVFKINHKQASFDPLTSNIAFRAASELILNNSNSGKTPDEIFHGISDEFWFWLNTEGVRRNVRLRNILPGAPSDDIQQLFTGSKGDSTLKRGFEYYQLVKQQYQKYKGDISLADNILDFGCGWGRTIRYFMKDIQPSKIWGCDPVEEMIDFCKQNKFCNFKHVSPYPPTPFQDNTFDLIYSYSVFSHLSEEFHFQILHEIKRILKPGGIYITTTRHRNFFKECAKMRQRKDLDTGWQKAIALSFPDTEGSLKAYDEGVYCHHSSNSEKWPYWGDTAIPKKYVVEHWSKTFNFLDYLEDLSQDAIVIQKP
jgi:SAM-dependent methyltransferase